MAKSQFSSDIKNVNQSKQGDRQGLKSLSRTKENILNNMNSNPAAYQNYMLQPQHPTYGATTSHVAVQPNGSNNPRHQKNNRPWTSTQNTQLNNGKNNRNFSEQASSAMMNGNNLTNKKSQIKSSAPTPPINPSPYQQQNFPEIAQKTPEKLFNQTFNYNLSRNKNNNNHPQNSSRGNSNSTNSSGLGVTNNGINSNFMPSQNYIHQQHATNFDMSSTVNGVGGGANNISNNEIMTNEFQSILLTEKDERFRYLIKHGTVQQVQAGGNIIFAELPQIQGIWVCYRRPVEREQNIEKLNLDGLDLYHMPLLEGEEQLQILTYQHNRISQIENVVSLPQLLYIDLYDNLIQEIDQSFTAVSQLRVLLLPQNQLTKIKNLESLIRLEVLDLHSNKIQKIEGLNRLTHLRILNLANNLISRIEGLEYLTNLSELNLQINIIQTLENTSHLYKLEKLIMANNRIDNYESLKQIRTMTALQEINLEGNPIAKNQIEYAHSLLANSLSLLTVDHQTVQVLKEQMRLEESNAALLLQNQTHKKSDIPVVKNSSTPNIYANGIPSNNRTTGAPLNSENMAINEVITIIGLQWQKELERVQQIELISTTQKELKKESLVEGGHAQIEDDKILFIYGNAYEIVLSNENFQESIECIQLQYILFDFLMETSILNHLRKFKKLQEIILQDNHISSLLQLAQLEVVSNIQYIHIQNNPVCRYSNLREFIVYRFPTISQINGQDVQEADQTKAQVIFNQFDRILQLPEQFFNAENMRNFPIEFDNKNFQKDKTYVKTINQIISEVSDNFAKNIIENSVSNHYAQQRLEYLLDQYATDFIKKIHVHLK